MDRATRQAESMTGDALAEQDACREALRDYHRRRMANVGDTRIISELAGLIEQAKAAGLGLADRGAYDGGGVMPRPRPEDYRTGAEYRWSHKLWKARHGGSMIGNVAVAMIAGGITGSRVALAVFVVLTVTVVTLARRRA